MTLEEKHANRYYIKKVKWHPWGWVTLCGDGTFPIHRGTYLQCLRYANQLQTAFYDGLYVGQTKDKL
jgi:hypothetical protein